MMDIPEPSEEAIGLVQRFLAIGGTTIGEMALQIDDLVAKAVETERERILALLLESARVAEDIYGEALKAGDSDFELLRWSIRIEDADAAIRIVKGGKW